MAEKEQKNYQVFLNDNGEDIATYSQLNYEEAQSIVRNLLVTYVVKHPKAIVSLVEEG